MSYLRRIRSDRLTGAFTALLMALALLLVLVSATGVPSASAAQKPPAPPPVSSIPKKLPPAENSETRLQPNTVHLLRLLEHLFPYYANGGVIGGYRQDPIADHPSGQALDIMMANDGQDPASVNEGHKVAAFLMANASQLGVTYMVWRQNIWYPGRDWREMSNRGNWTDNHMNHIHVLVDGSFDASDDLVLPKDLRIKLDEMPNGEALRKEHEARVAILQKIDTAKVRIAAAETVHRRLTDKNSQRAIALEAARMRVAQAVRESYMLGMDADLMSTSLLLVSGTNTDPTMVLALERTLRAQGEGVADALTALTAAAAELAQNESELAAGRGELSAAEDELRELDAN